MCIESSGSKRCSQKHKIGPQEKFCNNYPPCREVWASGKKVVKFIGYDAGEHYRSDKVLLRDLADPKYSKWYPLMEWGWDREACIRAIEAAGLPQPGKSSCFFCPSMRAEEIIDLNRGMVEALAAAIEFRSEESGSHVRRIHDITYHLLTRTELGRDIPPADVPQIALASILHDVGKIAVPDAILNKPGRLTPEEYEVIKAHTVQGEKLLSSIPQFQTHPSYRYACDIARHHHERWDGRGYPDGLSGEEISVWAQVVSLADVYDALSCKRVYKNPIPREQVLEMIRGGACGVFSPRLLDCFFSAEEELARLYESGKPEMIRRSMF